MAGNPATRERMLEWQFNIGAPTRPTAFFISYHTGDPGTTGANESAALARTSYDTWAVGTADDGTIQNSGTGQSAAASGSDTITHFGIWSASTAGTYYVGGSVTTPRAVTPGESLAFGDGDLTSSIG